MGSSAICCPPASQLSAEHLGRHLFVTRSHAGHHYLPFYSAVAGRQRGTSGPYGPLTGAVFGGDGAGRAAGRSAPPTRHVSLRGPAHCAATGGSASGASTCAEPCKVAVKVSGGGKKAYTTTFVAIGTKAHHRAGPPRQADRPRPCGRQAAREQDAEALSSAAERRDVAGTPRGAGRPAWPGARRPRSSPWSRAAPRPARSGRSRRRSASSPSAAAARPRAVGLQVGVGPCDQAYAALAHMCPSPKDASALPISA